MQTPWCMLLMLVELQMQKVGSDAGRKMGEEIGWLMRLGLRKGH